MGHYAQRTVQVSGAVQLAAAHQWDCDGPAGEGISVAVTVTSPRARADMVRRDQFHFHGRCGQVKDTELQSTFLLCRALADTDADGCMNVNEFSIACKLINLKLRGFEVPKVLPPSLLMSLASVGGTPTRTPSGAMSPASTGGPPPVPPQPAFMQQQLHQQHQQQQVNAAPPRPQPPQPVLAQPQSAPVAAGPPPIPPQPLVLPQTVGMVAQPLIPMNNVVAQAQPIPGYTMPTATPAYAAIPPTQVVKPMEANLLDSSSLIGSVAPTIPQAIPAAIPGQIPGQIAGMIPTSIPGQLPGTMMGMPGVAPLVSGVVPNAMPTTFPTAVIPPMAPASVVSPPTAAVAAVPAPPTPPSGTQSRSMSMTGTLDQRAPSIESPTAGEWAVKGPSKLKYTQLFNSLDKTRSGYLTGTQARGVFIQSKLPQMTLAKIWGLSDMDTDGRLGCEEFVLAMYLCEMAVQGQPVPDKLPPELIPPSFRKGGSKVASRSGSVAGSRHGSVSSQGAAAELDPSAGLPQCKYSFDRGRFLSRD